MGIVGRIFGIVQLYENSCNEPWTVFAKASEPWAGEPTMMLLGMNMIGPGSYVPLDPKQFVRNKIRAGRGRSNPHMRRTGDTEEEGQIELPDQVSEQANLTPERVVTIKPIMTGLETAFWEVSGVVEHGLWQWMIIDQASKFLYHSIADAHKSEYCRHWWDGDAYASGSFTPEPILGWQTVALLNDRYSHGLVHAGHGQPYCDSPGSLHVQCAWWGMIQPGTAIGYYGARLTASTPQGRMILAEQGIEAYAPGATVQFGFDGNFPTPGIAHFEIYASGAWAIPNGCNVMAQWTEGPRPGVPINPRTTTWRPAKGHHHRKHGDSILTKTEGSGSVEYQWDPPPKV